MVKKSDNQPAHQEKVTTMDQISAGGVAFRWKDFGTTFGRVEKVESPHTFSYRWVNGPNQEPTANNTTLVEGAESLARAHARGAPVVAEQRPPAAGGAEAPFAAEGLERITIYSAR